MKKLEKLGAGVLLVVLASVATAAAPTPAEIAFAQMVLEKAAAQVVAQPAPVVLQAVPVYVPPAPVAVVVQPVAAPVPVAMAAPVAVELSPVAAVIPPGITFTGEATPAVDEQPATVCVINVKGETPLTLNSILWVAKQNGCSVNLR